VKIVGQVTPHFSWSECESHETPPVQVPENLRANCLATCIELERIRAACLGQKLTVTRVYSTPGHNATIPGAAKGSWHLQALAADILPPGEMTARALFLKVQQVTVLSAESRVKYIKLYRDGHVHFDLRPAPQLVCEVEP
jgi:hypothetical protein